MLRREAAAGRLRWDPARARRCLDALAAPRCAAPGAMVLVEHCHALFAAAVGPGGTCYAVAARTDLGEWAGEGECVGWDGGLGQTCPSDVCGATCPAPVPMGAPCTGTDCGPDAFCDTALLGSNTCLPRKGDAAPCRGAGECAADLFCRGPSGGSCSYLDDACTCAPDLGPGDPCTSSSQCPPPLQCLTSAAGGATCRGTTGAAGDACSFAAGEAPPCAPGLACVSSATGYRSCEPPRVEGEPCADGADCADGLLCRAEGRCGRPSLEGGPCLPRTAANWADYEGDCAAGLACIGSSCAPEPRAPGEACDPQTTDCYGAGVMCDPDQLRCEPVGLAPGAPCGGDGKCAWDRGLYCDGAVCRERKPGGAPCSSPAECQVFGCGPDGLCPTACGW